VADIGEGGGTNTTSITMASVQARANGNGTAVQPGKVEKDGAYENIFLFIPNLIGMRIPSISPHTS
jgi:hypothetical protein